MKKIPLSKILIGQKLLQTLPSSLGDAAGMLKNKYSDLRRHYQKIRKEWPSYQ